MDRRKFIIGCATGLGISCYGCFRDNIFKNTIKTSQTTEDSDKLIKVLDIHIAEHCNLNCKYCAHFSNIAEPEFYDLKQFEKDIDKLSSTAKNKIGSIHLLGGEPLLNPRINKYCDLTRKYFPNTPIEVVTNGTLIETIDESFFKTLEKNSISIYASYYPIEIRWRNILKKLKMYDIEFSIGGIQKYTINMKDITNDTDIKRLRIPPPRRYFYKANLNENGIFDRKKTFAKCWLGKICNQFYEGKLYHCAIIAYIRHFNKKFNTNFEVTDKDYIDIYKVKDTSEISDFLKTPPPFCRYCGKFINDTPWERSATHDISEWT